MHEDYCICHIDEDEVTGLHEVHYVTVKLGHVLDFLLLNFIT